MKEINVNLKDKLNLSKNKFLILLCPKAQRLYLLAFFEGEKMEKYNEIVKLVKKCAEILKNVDKNKEEKTKSDGSLVTKYDLIIDDMLKDGLKKIMNYPILSEEHSEVIDDTYFVVDPIDGTNNFNRGIEHFGIMVAFVKNGITMFSIVDMPLLNRTYTAIRNIGSYINGKKISVRKPTNRLVGNINLNKKEALKIIDKVIEQKKYKFEFRCLYGACAPLCFVADGTFDFTIQIGGLSIWDIVPTQLIVEEAGGVYEVRKYDENKYSVITGGEESIKIIKKIIEGDDKNKSDGIIAVH